MLSGCVLWLSHQIHRSIAFIAAWLPPSEGQSVSDVIFSDDSAGIANDFRGKLVPLLVIGT